MYTNKDKLAILAKPHLTVRDVQILEACGQQKAMEMITAFREWFEIKYKQPLYRRQVPTGDFVSWARIDEKRIRDYAALGY